MSKKRFTQPRNYTPDKNYWGVIVRRFTEQVLRHGFREIMADLAPEFTNPDFEVTVSMLNEWRTKLARMVRKGMNERKNMEIQIAFLAAIVWFLRQVDEEKWTEVPETMW